jgi:hypothetical protein
VPSRSFEIITTTASRRYRMCCLIYSRSRLSCAGNADALLIPPPISVLHREYEGSLMSLILQFNVHAAYLICFFNFAMSMLSYPLLWRPPSDVQHNEVPHDLTVRNDIAIEGTDLLLGRWITLPCFSNSSAFRFGGSHH